MNMKKRTPGGFHRNQILVELPVGTPNAKTTDANCDSHRAKAADAPCVKAAGASTTGRIRHPLQIILLVLLGCLVMTFVEAVLQPGYVVKSAIKVATFLLCIISYCMMNRNLDVLRSFRVKNRRSLLVSALLGAGVFALILGAYAVARQFIDFGAITPRLVGKENITGSTFLYVALYISVINSLLEEVFFRGFAFITLRRHTATWFAYGFSAIAFALYHLFIMSGWFSPGMFILILASLAVAGLFFNFMDRKSVIYHSWVIHMSANLAINTIGLRLFGLI